MEGKRFDWLSRSKSKDEDRESQHSKEKKSDSNSRDCPRLGCLIKKR